MQGGRSRSRDAGAGETTPAQSLAAWKEFAQEYRIMGPGFMQSLGRNRFDGEPA